MPLKNGQVDYGETQTQADYKREGLIAASRYRDDCWTGAEAAYELRGAPKGASRRPKKEDFRICLQLQLQLYVVPNTNTNTNNTKTNTNTNLNN